MKRSLIISTMFLLVFSMTTDAQGWRDNTDIYVRQSNYNSNHHHDNQYSDSNRNSNRHIRHYHLSKKQKRMLVRLQKELRVVKKHAFHDGFISRRERRRINELKFDIDKLLSNRSNQYRSVRNYRRSNNRCR